MNPSRRDVMAGAAASTLAGVPLSKAHAVQKRPNVLFLSLDDLNDWLGFLGGHPDAQTPHIDALAARSTAFTHAYCSAPGCNQSRTSLLTGLRPSTTGVYGNRQPFRLLDRGADIVTLPQLLRQSGYSVSGAGKIFHNKFPDPASWDSFYPERDEQWIEHPSEPANITAPTGDDLQEQLRWGGYEPGVMPGDEQTVRWAEQQLRGALPEPFFLAVGLNLPHFPWFVPKRFLDIYDPASITLPEVLPGDERDLPRLGKRAFHRMHKENLALHDQNLVRQAVAAYLAAISYVDEQVGRILAALDGGSHTDDTLIVLWSDHGYHLGEKTNWSKFTLWEEATRVPLLIARPGQAGAKCDVPVSLLDLYPTLAELCGASPPLAIEGESIVRLLDNPASIENRRVLTTHYRGNHGARDRSWRYIRYEDGGEELYDHRDDPMEWRNLAQDPAYRQVIDDMASALPTTDAKNAPSVRWPRDRDRVMDAIWVPAGGRQ